MFAASCRELQAGSLRSPKQKQRSAACVLLQRLRADAQRLGRAEALGMVHLLYLGRGRDRLAGRDDSRQVAQRVAPGVQQIDEEDRAIFPQFVMIAHPFGAETFACENLL